MNPQGAFDTWRSRADHPKRANAIESVQDHDEPAVRAQQMARLFHAASIRRTNYPNLRALCLCDVRGHGERAFAIARASVTGLFSRDTYHPRLHTTSDFGIIFGDTVGRTLAQPIKRPVGIRLLGRQTTAKDFAPS
jgi:hypothetical protein